jgi:hypothetical protein
MEQKSYARHSPYTCAPTGSTALLLVLYVQHLPYTVNGSAFIQILTDLFPRKSKR